MSDTSSDRAMDPLETILRPVTRMLNRNIRETTPARELCAELAGTVAAVRVSNTALAMYFTFDSESVSLSSESTDEPDIAISGSIITLARVAGSGDEQSVRDGSLELAGDAHKAQAFQKLLAYAKPDLEEELSNVIGDSAAHGIGQFARGVSGWARQARATMGENVKEYLQEESRDVPSRYEADRFSTDVGKLRDDVERLAARIDRLANKSSG
ncbi:MAG: SCP2 sterol-binding domain-containing protein [Gammaproteobacteria bacterium]|nr:SCP2 sterol-binding domain-containing protein [Gammaproteobacteria bacterium]